MESNLGPNLYTVSQDSMIRVFTMKQDKSGADKVYEAKIPINTFATKIFKTTTSYLVFTLNNGQFLGWNLGNSPPNFDELKDNCHTSAISALVLHDNFVLTADMQGTVSIRGL